MEKEAYSAEFNLLKNVLQSNFNSLREELDDHREAINENSCEIEQNYNDLNDLYEKMEKLGSRVDEIHFMFKQILNSTKFRIDLSKTEQSVFLVLYTCENFLSAQDIAQKAGIEMQEAESMLLLLLDKGIMVEREVIENKEYFRLDKNFRMRQAKDKLVHIDPEVKMQYQNTLLEKFFSMN